jgi:hypothetical protein
MIKEMIRAYFEKLQGERIALIHLMNECPPGSFGFERFERCKLALAFCDLKIVILAAFDFERIPF